MMSSSDGHPGGSADPVVGRVFLDRYRVVRKLEQRDGAGVYAAQHLFADRPVAVEVVASAHASPAAVERFLEEARVVARVGHENVVEIFNGGRSPEGGVFLATEVLEGTDLSRVLGADGPLLWDRAQGIVLQLAAALAAVHRHGVVHGDVRADNVLLVPRAGRRDFVKLVDFGVARLNAEARPSAADVREDVSALGALTYELVTGQGVDATGAPPPAPTTLRPPGSLPADLDAVLLRALEPDPEKRWPDMTAFAEAVGRCRLTRRQSVRVEALAHAELSGKPGAFEADARLRRRAWAIGSVVAAVAIAIGVLNVITTAQGHVRISTVPADAELKFNGLSVAARSPVVLEAAPGRYSLVVSRAGYVTAERTVDVGAGATVQVPVELAAAPPSPTAAVPAAAP